MNSLRIEGQKTISFELVQQFNWEIPDFVIVPGGNLGNVSAIGKGFQMFYDLGLINKLPRLVCAQAERANPLYRSFKHQFKTFEPIQAQKTLASAIQIGDPVSVKKAIRTLKAFEGIVEEATEGELANAASKANRTGLLCCPHTGVALAVLEKLVSRGVIKKKDKVVVISTANGLKFTDFLFKCLTDKIPVVESDYAFEAIGLVEKPFIQSIQCTRSRGVSIWVGHAPFNTPVTVDARELMQEKIVMGSMYGSAQPKITFNRLLNLYKSGKLRLDELISKTYILEDVNDAFVALGNGEVARSTVTFE